MTPEQAAEWRGKLRQLVQQGAAGVPAIGEFLRKNTDFDFGDSAGALGYGSARAALFDALLQIGGPQATSVLLQTMQTTAEPREVAVLARELETLAPEQYRQEALSAARQALAMAGSGKLEGADVGPLFELMYKYGGTGVVPELEQAAKQWNYYATIALAQLPDGAGIPALIQIAQGTSAPKGNAVELLAQTAPQYPEARAALLDLARANKIPPSLWPYLTPLLAGGQYRYQDSAFDDSLTEGSRRARESGHVLSGNQHFYTAPDVGSLTPDQINQRMALIDDLRSATSDPVALNALQDSRDRLAKLLPASVATTP